ncbi:CBS domain-containing protein [Candidatus Bathyarchaeota archaeon]|nr:CBS domain-containing protein [Candidatus Bathyarchaeota archaeon]
MKIAKLMTQPVQKIDENSTIQEAVERMSRERVGSLIVTNGNDIGIITEKDILSQVLARHSNLTKIKVKDVMSSPLITVEKDIEGEDALRTMAEHGIRRLPITENGRIIGIFSTADVTKLAEMSNVTP